MINAVFRFRDKRGIAFFNVWKNSILCENRSKRIVFQSELLTNRSLHKGWIHLRRRLGMDFEQLKPDVIAYSKTIGIDKIGFASASPF